MGCILFSIWWLISAAVALLLSSRPLYAGVLTESVCSDSGILKQSVELISFELA